jgi:hypothetical protein
MAIQLQREILFGAEQVIKDLKKIEPDLYKQLRKDIVTEIKPLYAKIKANIPPVSPLSGFYHNGRTAWGGPIKVVGKISTRKRRGRTSLVSIRTTNTAVEIIDMAGRKSRGDTPAGRAMIQNLPGKASRYIYPAVNNYVTTLNQSVIRAIDNYAKTINVELAKKPITN